ncbi:response regulator [Cupriavidus pinatubonensis]|uniref:response regulator n=1 Tax=Cupriavidus pinatubonensis TaxID=248026 RepID=UPI0015E32069|nr:response regulator [Cupriavidus pinatubonensis]
MTANSGARNRPRSVMVGQGDAFFLGALPHLDVCRFCHFLTILGRLGIAHRKALAMPGHVLIVDDDAETRRLLREYLQKQGYRATAVADGRALRAALGTARPDLIVLDLMLVGKDGLELCRDLRTRSNLPIIMLTARDEETDRVVGLEMGADDYVVKPFNPRELLARIKSVLRRARSLPDNLEPEAAAWFKFSGWVLDAATRNLTSDRAPMPEDGPLEVARAAHAFNTMQASLSRYLRERSATLAAMSHDLKTPITRLRLRAELLDDGELKQKISQDLHDMESMVQATLAFMRGGDSAEPIQPLDVTALLESLQADAEEVGAHVSIEGSTDRPYPGRPQALKRCLSNLVDNACKYGNRAEILVEDDERQLVIRVLDQGPGISEAQLERVFEPFYRIERSRSRDTGGTGLGLTIARAIAQIHGGTLVLHNLKRGGLEAMLTLPRPATVIDDR